jgi:hypothetical protein
MTIPDGAMELAEYKDQLRGYRRRIGAILDTAREAFLGAMHGDSNVLTWYGEQFWVDRVRGLVLPMFVFDATPAGHTLVDDGDGGEVHDNLVCRPAISSSACSAPCWRGPRTGARGR